MAAIPMIEPRDSQPNDLTTKRANSTNHEGQRPSPRQASTLSAAWSVRRIELDRTSSSSRLVIVLAVLRAGRVAPGGGGWSIKAVEPFPPDVETAAPLAAEDDEPVAFAEPAGRSDPNFQRDAVPLGGAALGVESLAAGRIGPGEDQFRHGHSDQPFRPLAAAWRRLGMITASGSVDVHLPIIR
jgi:hypothetical protein